MDKSLEQIKSEWDKHQNMLESSAYKRLKEESPKEFEPKTIFFFSEGDAGDIDWQNSFWLKAAVVYHAVTGTHINPRAASNPAARLLVRTAKYCSSQEVEGKKEEINQGKQEEINQGRKKEEINPGKQEEINQGRKQEEINPGKQEEINPGKKEEINQERKQEEINQGKQEEINQGRKKEEINPGKQEEINQGRKQEEINPGKQEEINQGRKKEEINPGKQEEINQGRKQEEINPGKQEEINQGRKKEEINPGKQKEINEEFLKNLSVQQKQFVDGVYLVVGFLPALKSNFREKWSREETDNSYLSTRSHEIVTDIIKIGNQITLDCVLRVVKHVGAAIKNAKDALFPASNAADNNDLCAAIGKYELGFSKESFHEVLYPFCWYYSPFYHKPNTANEKSVMDEVIKESNFLLECVHEYVKRAWGMQISGAASGDAAGSGYAYSTPTARGLRRAGVRFVPAHAEGSAMVRFAEPALHLPILVYDFKVETVVRNLMALESLRGDHPKPLTRYFQFMNELVGDIGDVKVLRRAGVIRGGSKAGKEVLEMVKKIDGYATYPSTFAAIDGEIKKARDYHERRMKSFLVRHQPAVVWVSSVAAASVIVTAVYAARRRSERA